MMRTNQRRLSAWAHIPKVRDEESEWVCPNRANAFHGLLALITRSPGSILFAPFGWAVVALFGPTSSREKVWLSALVGAAAAWPLLLPV
jgi:hypothetical protein